MTELEKKKKNIELARVTLARQELELKIDERLEEIKKLQDAIILQDNRIEELKKELNLK